MNTSWPPDSSRCPEHIQQALKDYAATGIPRGGFVTAVLENDLKEAIGRADFSNGEKLAHIVAWCYSYLPSACWGSKERVTKWIEKHEAQREKAALARTAEG